MEKRNVVLLPGDGIGPEITAAVATTFEKANVPISWKTCPVGLDVIERDPSGIEEETLAEIRECRVALKGPTTTPSGTGHRSVNVHLRKRLGLYANVRPIRPLPNIQVPFPEINLVTIRENVEDTYGGQEYLQSPDVAKTLKMITRVGCEDIIRFAFEYAKAHQRKKITCVHKANIHKLTDGLFLRVFQEIQSEYSEIEAEDLLVDNVCMQLVTHPEQFDVMVMPNLYGDILSDLCAGLIGGLGVAPSGNIGHNVAVFEAVHGSAPNITGKDLANPTALLRSALMMLRYLGYQQHAEAISSALHQTLKSGATTKDLGGNLSTSEFVAQLCACIEPVQTDHVEVVRTATRLTTPTDSGVLFDGIKGVDIFLQRTTMPELPQQLGPLQLEAVANRGSLFQSDSFPITASNVFCARYITESGFITEDEVGVLLHQLDQLKISWVSCHKLYSLAGNDSYSPIS